MRKDGKRLKTLDPMTTIIPYIMKQRNDALNAITVRVPYAPMHDYLAKKRKEGVSYSYMGLVLAAYVRTVAEYPFLNRFIVNKKFYARNELAVSMVVLKDGGKGEETIDKLKFEPTDTIADVAQKLDTFIHKNRATEEDNSTDKFMRFFAKSSLLLSMGVGFLKWLDKHGLWPKKMIDISPFHSSIVISNLASIRTNHLHHHCYSFGTVSTVLTMGNIQSIPQSKDGQIVLEKQMPLGIMMDERIGTGLAFARAFQTLTHYLKHPELLEAPPEQVNTEI